MRALLGLLVLSLSIPACAISSDEGDTDSSEDAVKVDTSSPQARAQYDANIAFAKSYKPRCTASSDATRPRVLVTGFGRFMSVTNNATGRIMNALVPDAKYPETEPPPDGEVDLPAPQLSVGSTTITLPHAGKVDVCAMILPVYWDLAAALIAKEVDALGPSLVIMDGVAGSRQPLWIELGSVNRAEALDDGSNQLKPAVGKNKDTAPIITGLGKADQARGLLMSWNQVRAAASTAIAKHAKDMEGEERFDAFMSGVELAGYPRESNTYLCNNVTYVTNFLMDHPGKSVPLMRASVKKPGASNELDVKIKRDVRNVPRVFMHWPSDIEGKHIDAGADIIRAVIDAQLTATANGEPPTVGDNANANPDLAGGAFF